jgi:hypothetical protein
MLAVLFDLLAMSADFLAECSVWQAKLSTQALLLCWMFMLITLGMLDMFALLPCCQFCI